jgi:hypothetical protein
LQAIIDLELWEAVQSRLAANAVERSTGDRAKNPSLLAGLLFDGDGNRMTPTHAVKKGRRYRYYISLRPNARTLHLDPGGSERVLKRQIGSSSFAVRIIRAWPPSSSAISTPSLRH